MNIFNIFRNNFYRMLAKKMIIIDALLFIPLMIVGGVYFNSKIQTKANVAVISANQKFNIENKYIKFNIVKKAPNVSDLVLNKYDAVIIDNGKGNFKIATIKSDKLKKQIENFLKNPKLVTNISNSGDKRGVGTNIIGFLIMVVIVLQIQFMLLYPEDRDVGTFRRILISPVSGGEYLISQGIFDFIIAFVPTYIAVIAAKVIFNVNIGFTYLKLAGVLSLLILLGTAFALFIASIMDDVDNASMLGNSIIMITSVLAGSFYSFTNNNKIFNSIVKAIPFKGYMTLVQGIENGKSLSNYYGELTYILVISLILFIIGTFVTKRNLNTGKY